MALCRIVATDDKHQKNFNLVSRTWTPIDLWHLRCGLTRHTKRVFSCETPLCAPKTTVSCHMRDARTSSSTTWFVFRCRTPVGVALSSGHLVLQPASFFIRLKAKAFDIYHRAALWLASPIIGLHSINCWLGVLVGMCSAATIQSAAIKETWFAPLSRVTA